MLNSKLEELGYSTEDGEPLLRLILLGLKGSEFPNGLRVNYRTVLDMNKEKLRVLTKEKYPNQYNRKMTNADMQLLLFGLQPNATPTPILPPSPLRKRKKRREETKEKEKKQRAATLHDCETKPMPEDGNKKKAFASKTRCNREGNAAHRRTKMDGNGGTFNEFKKTKQRLAKELAMWKKGENTRFVEQEKNPELFHCCLGLINAASYNPHACNPPFDFDREDDNANALGEHLKNEYGIACENWDTKCSLLGKTNRCLCDMRLDMIKNRYDPEHVKLWKKHIHAYEEDNFHFVPPKSTNRKYIHKDGRDKFIAVKLKSVIDFKFDPNAFKPPAKPPILPPIAELTTIQATRQATSSTG